MGVSKNLKIKSNLIAIEQKNSKLGIFTNFRLFFSNFVNLLNDFRIYSPLLFTSYINQGLEIAC